MLVQRSMQQSARMVLLHDTLLARSFAPATLISQQSRLQKRYKASTTTTTTTTPTSNPGITISTPSSGYQILTSQRLMRPTSPHLTIYQPQIPWLLSGLNRITGCVVSGGFYLFGFAYLVSPVLGWHLESATLAEWFAGLGVVTRGLIKFGVAWPVAFHSFNGVRHLVWDSGRELANKSVVRTGWAVVGLSFVGAGALTFLW